MTSLLRDFFAKMPTIRIMLVAASNLQGFTIGVQYNGVYSRVLRFDKTEIKKAI